MRSRKQRRLAPQPLRHGRALPPRPAPALDPGPKLLHLLGKYRAPPSHEPPSSSWAHERSAPARWSHACLPKGHHGNPYDGHTLKGSLVQVKALTGWKPMHAFCDKGYRGMTRTIPGVRVHLSGGRKRSRALRRWMKQRSAVEPVIGHMKSDNGMDRNHLSGRDGDVMNAMLSGCGFNLRKLLRAFLSTFSRFYFLWLCIRCWIGTTIRPTPYLLPVEN
jgi:hypothetical protein